MSRSVAAGSPASADEGIPKNLHGRGERELTEFLRRYGSGLRATARHYAASPQDAEDAYQRAVELLMTKGPEGNARVRASWMHTVIRREALRLRERQRRVTAAGDGSQVEQIMGSGGAASSLPEAADPAEVYERRDRYVQFRQAFVRLKRDEQRALCLLGEGYSYSEIGEITGWSWTKINRLLSEGRARMRQMLEGLESGRRCAELAGPLSRLSDGEATEAEIGAVHDHLQACLACRATLAGYRAAPRRAAALFPAVPTAPSLGDRLQELSVWLQSSLPGRGGLNETATAIASGGGARGGGMATLAKLAVICAGAGGGTVACVATGVLPAPPIAGIERPPQEAANRPESAADEPSVLPVAPIEAPVLSDTHTPERDNSSGGKSRRESVAPIPPPQREEREKDPHEAEFGAESAGAPLGFAGGGARTDPRTPAPAGSATQSEAAAAGAVTAPQVTQRDPGGKGTGSPDTTAISPTRPPIAGGTEFAP